MTDDPVFTGNETGISGELMPLPSQFILMFAG